MPCVNRAEKHVGDLPLCRMHMEQFAGIALAFIERGVWCFTEEELAELAEQCSRSNGSENRKGKT